MATEIIQRSMIDLALDNMSTGFRKEEAVLKSGINRAWNRLTEARKTAVKTRDDKIDAEDRGRKRNRNAEVAAYKEASVKPNPPSYESHQQALAGIDASYDNEVQHARDICMAAGKSAEDDFRTDTKELIETFTKDIHTVLETLQTTHP